MPQKKIETIEYQCCRCGYKWITRKNGKESKDKPNSCAGCKSSLWDTPRKNTKPKPRIYTRQVKPSKVPEVETKGVKLLPYKPDKLDSWNATSKCILCDKPGISHSYRLWNHKRGHLLECLHIVSNNGKFVKIQACSEKPSCIFYATTFSDMGKSSPTNEQLHKESNERREYWKTHSVPKEIIEDALKRS